MDVDDDVFVRYCSDEESSDYEGGVTAGGKTASGKSKSGNDFENVDTKSKVPKSKKKDKDKNCCVSLFEKTFTYFFPARAKTCYTYQGQWLRRMLWCAILNHWFFFVFCLYFVGFKSTLSNMALAFSAYSCSLTLRLKSVYCYFCLLILGMCTEIYSDLFQKKDSI